MLSTKPLSLSFLWLARTFLAPAEPTRARADSPERSRSHAASPRISARFRIAAADGNLRGHNRSPFDSRRARARFDKSNTRRCGAVRQTGADGKRNARRRSEQAWPLRSVNSPRPPRCLSREWPVYMLTLCLRVSLPLPSLAGSRLPPLSRPGTDDPRLSPRPPRSIILLLCRYL